MKTNTDSVGAPAAAGGLIYSPSGNWWNRPRQAEQDGLAHTGLPAVGGMLWNGTNWDRPRGAMAGTLLASAARTASVTAANQTNINARGVIVNVRVTTAGTGGLQVVIMGIDPTSSTQVRLLDSGPSAIAATSGRDWAYEVSPGASEVHLPAAGFGVDMRTGGGLPRTWNVTIFHSDASSWTYSVSYMTLV